MLKSLEILVPGLAVTGLVLTSSYFIADQFVVDMPAPLRGAAIPAAVAATETQTPVSEGDAMPETVSLALGRPALTEEVAAWDFDVRPDGLGLPEGSGSVEVGEEVYVENCALCHGDFGEGVDRWPVLTGGQGSLTNDRPVKTIGSYWPYLSTVYDYIHRAMPFGNAGSLTDDDVYAITAYLLYMNDLVDEDFELSHENFADIRLENEDNFRPDDRAETEYAAFSGEVCMENCKASVEITARAAVVDVTPDDAAARERRDAAAAAAEGSVAVAAVAAPDAEVPKASDDAELVAAGEKAFKKCSACHQVGADAKNRVGPILTGIVGSTAGSVEGFKYSGAFETARTDDLVWSEEALAEFLAKPRDYLKGTKMAFPGFKDPADIEAVIAYLKTFGG